MDIHPSSTSGVWYVIDQGYERPLLLVDLNKRDTLRTFGQKGDSYGQLNAPFDVVGPTAVTPDSLYVFDKFKGKINVYDTSSAFVRQISLDFPGVFSEAKRITEREFLLSTNFGDKTYARLNLDNNKLTFPLRDTFYPVPIEGFDVPDDAYGELSVSVTALDLTRNKTFIATTAYDMVQAYTTDGDLLDRFQGPDLIKPTGQVDNNGYLVRHEENVFWAYDTPGFTYKKFVIFGYSGQQLDHKSEMDLKWFRSKELIVFSAETTQPLARIQFNDIYFSRTHFDETSGNLYLLDVNPDREGGNILYFNLSKTLEGLKDY